MDRFGPQPRCLVPNAAATLAVLLIAIFKIRFILHDFMELRYAPAMLRRIADAWLLFLFVAVIRCYYAPALA